MFENFSLDLIIFLIFAMPGFLFLKMFGVKNRTNFEYTVLSLFWGILLVTLYYYIFPIERFNLFIQNPFAGAIIFSIFSILFALLIKGFIEFIRKASNGTW
jgi:hypothetical protein